MLTLRLEPMVEKSESLKEDPHGLNLIGKGPSFEIPESLLEKMIHQLPVPLKNYLTFSQYLILGYSRLHTGASFLVQVPAGFPPPLHLLPLGVQTLHQ